MAHAVTSSTPGTRARPVLLTLALAYGLVGPVLFIVVFLLEGATRADYDPFRYPISSLSIGALGWIQAANFLMVGLSLIVFAFGIRRALGISRGIGWVPALIGLAGVGLCGAGLFTTDPVYGYPSNAPLVLAQYSTHGHLHDTLSVLLFLGLPIACFVQCRRFLQAGERAWAIYSLLAGLGMLATFFLAGAGFKQTPGLVDVAGVIQRVSVAIGLTWVSVLALRYLRDTRSLEAQASGAPAPSAQAHGE